MLVGYLDIKKLIKKNQRFGTLRKLHSKKVCSEQRRKKCGKNKQRIQSNNRSDQWGMCQYLMINFGTEEVSIKLSL